ncbi:ATP-dependent DNA helicase [Trichonephila clavipes]|nr:ATP-dependent DNA helicase [Trichonephila clavipes]
MFGGLNVLLFGDLMQLPPRKPSIRSTSKNGSSDTFVALILFNRAKRVYETKRCCDKFVNILNALRIGEMTTEHVFDLMQKVSSNSSREFSIEKALRIYPTNQQVNKHNAAVLEHLRKKNTQMFKIIAQDQLLDGTKNNDHIDINNIIHSNINTKQEDFQKN